MMIWIFYWDILGFKHLFCAPDAYLDSLRMVKG